MLGDLLAAPAPTVRHDLGPVLTAVLAVRRTVVNYHDLVLQTQAEDPAHAAAVEATQQTVGALVRELQGLMEQVRKLQTIGDQLDRVRDELRSA